MIPSQGLAGLTAQPKGGLPASSSGGQAMAKYFDLAKKLSDGQLADVMAGKSMDVPQFVAMTEAMGRRQLRQAVEGAQAQAQAQQPTVKDQLLADYQQGRQAHMIPEQRAAGIDQLPADNMVALGEGHATGGIISFDGGGEVPRFYGGGNPWDRLRQNDQDPDVFLSNAWFKKNFEGEGGIAGSSAAKRKASIEKQLSLNAKENPEFGEPIVRSDEDPYGAAKQSTNTVVPNSAPAVTEPPINTNAPQGKGKPDSGLPAIDISKPTTFERRASPYAGMSAEKVDVEGLKDKGFGEGLMRASQMILSKPRLSEAIGAGLGALADQGLATRKEINAAKKDARDYDLLLTKSKEAFEQGQDQLGFHYDELAEKKRHNPIMEQAALITANAHMKSAQGKENAPDAQMIKLAYEHLDKQLKDNIQFRQKFNQWSPDEQMQYISALAMQNKQLYTGMQSPGKSGAPVKFLGFES